MKQSKKEELKKALKHMDFWFKPTKRKKVSFKYLQTLARRAKKTFPNSFFERF